jgi:hypothetical protein
MDSFLRFGACHYVPYENAEYQTFGEGAMGVAMLIKHDWNKRRILNTPTYVQSSQWRVASASHKTCAVVEKQIPPA